MRMDLLLCIDGTGSMNRILEDVKANISKFVNNLIKRFANEFGKLDNCRIKIIVFRNIDVDGEKWFQETPFYDLEKSVKKLNNFLESIEASGGSKESPYEDALSALAIGLTNSNWKFSKDSIQVIGLWTDTRSKPITPKLKEYSKKLKNRVPQDYQELREYWNDIFLKKAPNARFLIFAPESYTWKIILDEWPQTIHYKSKSAGTNLKNPETILIKELLYDLTPSINEAYESRDYELKEDYLSDKRTTSKTNSKGLIFFDLVKSFIKKYTRLMKISFAIIAFSIVSFRVIGFSIFSIN